MVRERKGRYVARTASKCMSQCRAERASGVGGWAGVGDGSTPRELRTTFVSLMSHHGVSTEEIARLAGHASTRTTEVVYRRELRPVITTGAQIMDQIFGPGG
jgi:integrase